ncbi:MAG: hypothetical protein COS85_04290 [Armatimonadetes bacterium CG07_land_8_20_14_0_80_59_28]|nr:MAG: hypothetical protein COS85_04290 [Armatimonadetes bacterium CG07_land_8_20_14_0_80_59_28]PIX44161.1 MAG: hypothetical protein COZ56_05380 [Armatimonadetes bacterium CG_4_8_14_3_um_filter_58_9]PIY47521.1 MAG: hypothetical protein COZ05_04720 [Armatimonadetes bacterium CG_4_10_14_3_um_filter_59_10]
MKQIENDVAKRRKLMTGLIGAGALSFFVYLVIAPHRAWASLLLGNFYVLSLALFGVVFVAVNAIFNGAWATAFRRIPEAMVAYLPVAAALMLLTFVGHRSLYPWSCPEIVATDSLIQSKTTYLNTEFFLVRLVIAFGVWWGFSRALRAHSVQQDADGLVEHTRRIQALSAAFLIAFAVTFIFASFDWLMSLQPKWYSTIFPGYLFAGLLLAGSAAMLILVVWFRERGVLQRVTDHHLYELSRLLMAASTFWAYMWFCQYMLIYYTNIPEETVFYAQWRTGPWALLFPLNLILNWILPLVMFIRIRGRREGVTLVRVGAVVLLGRFIDLYQVIMPSVDSRLHVGFPEILVPAALLAVFLLLFFRRFQSAAPEPRQDPYLIESAGMEVS